MAREGLREEIGELATHIHAATAKLVKLIAELDSGAEPLGHGIRNTAHWLVINAGYDTWTANELVRVAQALKPLPRLTSAFSAGTLSFDKVRAVTKVAVAEDEHIWHDVAIQASGGQLARICNAFYRATAIKGDPTAEQQRRRQVRSWWREDGMLEIFATLPPEDGQVVLAAIESVVSRRMRSKPAEGEPEPMAPALNTWGARRADALVEVCERWLAEFEARDTRLSAQRRLVVHVDLETLTGDAAGGRCHLENGPAISPEVARRIGCDAEILAVIEKDGRPIDVGRLHRIEPPRLRHARQLRDQTCCFPGCGAPATDSPGHHVKHWAHGGATELDNEVSLCRYHHGRLHAGAFEVIADGAGGFRFETPEGKPIVPRARAVDPDSGGALALQAMAREMGLDISPLAPRAADGGRGFGLGYAIDVLSGASEFARKRAGPDG